MNSSPVAGIALLTAAVALFSALDATTPLVTAEMPVLLAVFIRYVFQSIFTTALAWPMCGRRVMQTAHLRLQILRGVLVMLVTVLAFASLQYVPVGEFTAIVMITPLLVSLLASRALGEIVTGARSLLVVLGFLGTLAIVRPSATAISWWMLLPLLLVAVNTALQLLTSKLAQTENAFTTQFYTSWVGTLFSAVPLGWVYSGSLEWHVWLALAAMGIAVAIGNLFVVMAFSRARASTLMPCMYIQIVCAVLGGWLLNAHLPDRYSMLGMVAIAVSGLGSMWLAFREEKPPSGGSPSLQGK